MNIRLESGYHLCKSEAHLGNVGFMYVRLALAEEREAIAEFGAEYERYRRNVPGFIPRLGDLIRGTKQHRAGQI